MSFGDDDGSGDDKILRENGGGGRGNIAGEQSEIERAGFLQAAGGGGKAESAREERLRKAVVSWAEDPQRIREVHGRDLRSSMRYGADSPE